MPAQFPGASLKLNTLFLPRLTFRSLVTSRRKVRDTLEPFSGCRQREGGELGGEGEGGEGGEGGRGRRGREREGGRGRRREGEEEECVVTNARQFTCRFLPGVRSWWNFFACLGLIGTLEGWLGGRRRRAGGRGEGEGRGECVQERGRRVESVKATELALR